VARPRFTAFLLAVFAGVALFLGAIGVYGVLAYAVGRRTQEFAVRLALGASGRDLLGGVLSEGARLTLAGVVLGLSGRSLRREHSHACCSASRQLTLACSQRSDCCWSRSASWHRIYGSPRDACQPAGSAAKRIATADPR
jgi:hypothetical protein